MMIRSTTLTLAGLLVIGGFSIAWGEIHFSKDLLKNDIQWFRSAEARTVADSVIQYQSPQGGWPKSTDLAKPPRTPEDIPPPGRGRANSLDNDATTVPMQFLARMTHATGKAKYRDSFLRGVDYLLAAQYPHGGWPQFWPLRKGYYSHITYNDDAMVRVMRVPRDVAKGEAPYDFVDDQRREKTAKVVARGIGCLLKTQIKQDGKLTAWCAQHDEKTLEPTWARAYEPPSLSGGESVGIVRFLMDDFSQISYERRNGYSYHGTWASSLLEKDYPRWRKKQNDTP